jgi:hypothetical protein
MDEGEFIDCVLELLPIYTTGKEVILQAEEADSASKSNISVFKEQRDAFDHLIRAMAAQWSDQAPPGKLQRDDYIKHHFSKARGHLFRAAYDALDSHSVILRKRIAQDMGSFSNEAITACFPDYYTTQHRIAQQAAVDIAARRKAKDIGDTETFQNFEEYRRIVKSLQDVRDACRAKVPALQEWSKKNAQSQIIWKVVLPILLALVGFVLGLVSQKSPTPVAPSQQPSAPAKAGAPS